MKKIVLSVLVAAFLAAGVYGGVATAQETGVEASAGQSSSLGAIWG
ncbi:hypothetical protein [Streptomyces mayteni]